MKFFREKEEDNEEEEDLEEAAIKIADEISRQTAIKLAGKISSADITLESRGTIKVGWFIHK